MKPAESIAYLRQLACLGLGSEAVMPTLLSTLHELVPSTRNEFYWTDSRGLVLNTCQEHVVPSTLQLYLEAHHLFQGEHEPFPGRIALGPLTVGNFRRYRTREYYERSNIHNLICREYRTRFELDCVIRDDGKPRGILMLFRDSSGRDFSTAEERLLAQLLPYFNQALEPAPRGAMEQLESEDCGIAITNAAGQLLHASPGVWHLLLQVMNPRLAPGIGWISPAKTLPEPLRRLCRNAADIQSGREAPPPTARIENAWGRFSFQAYPLEPVRDGFSEGSPIALLIRRELSLALRAMRKLKQLPLSSRQREVALLLALGEDSPSVQQRLGISSETLRDHTRKIYRRLDIHSRQALVNRLR